MTPIDAHPRRRRRLAARFAQERGFTMILALGVLMVTMLLTAAVMTAVLGDTALTRADLDGKRAYAAAQAGLQAYMYQINDNSTTQWWATCANDTVGVPSPVAVPGTTTGATYSYTPVPANTATACITSDPIGSLIDTATGVLQMKFSGYSGKAVRTIVASLRTVSPLSFLWYTVHETVDTSVGGSRCDVTPPPFYYSTPAPDSSCYIYWVSGDHMNGPMYTQDQLLIESGASPTFGRSKRDLIESEVPTTGLNDICAFSNCQGDPNILGTRVPDVQVTGTQVPLPTDNSNLLGDATKHGLALPGTTTLALNGTTATATNCSSSVSCSPPVTIDLTKQPIFYATNAAGCGSTSYTPTSISYPKGTTAQGSHYYGPCGDVYVSGNYTTPLTIAAANDIIVTDDITTTTDASGNPIGGATLGLVANEYVRVMHPCNAGNPDTTIDAAILTLAHSFFVDNYNCGGLPLGQLTVHGAIAQFFRGIVGQVGSNGYLKNYNYDDRLSVILPPYLFDIQNTAWTVFRETLCNPSPTASASTPTSCSYTGP
jgi:Tfp pilus assembly protein PilX